MIILMMLIMLITMMTLMIVISINSKFKLTSCHFGNLQPYVTFILIFNFKMNK